MKREQTSISDSTNWKSSRNEKVVTVTGGRSPRLMHIIASSYKSKDTNTSTKPSTAAKPLVVRTQQGPNQHLSDGEVPQLAQEGGLNREQSYEGTDI